MSNTQSWARRDAMRHNPSCTWLDLALFKLMVKLARLQVVNIAIDYFKFREAIR